MAGAGIAVAGSVAGAVASDALSDDAVGPSVVDTNPGEFAELRRPTSNSLKDILTNLSGTGTFDPNTANLGRLTAPITGVEQGLVNRAGQLAGGPSALQQQGRNVLGQTLGGQFLDPASNPFLQSTLDTATRRINERNQLQNQALIGQFKRAGQTLRTDPDRVGSSAFLNQARLSERDRLNAIGDVTGNILSQNFQNERNRQQQAVGQAEQITSQDINNAIQGLQATALPRLIEDLGVQRGIQEFNERIARLLQALTISGGISSNSNVVLPGVQAQQTPLGAGANAAITGLAQNFIDSGGFGQFGGGGGGSGAGLGPNASSGGTGFGFQGFNTTI